MHGTLVTLLCSGFLLFEGQVLYITHSEIRPKPHKFAVSAAGRATRPTPGEAPGGVTGDRRNLPRPARRGSSHCPYPRGPNAPEKKRERGGGGGEREKDSEETEREEKLCHFLFV